MVTNRDRHYLLLFLALGLGLGLGLGLVCPDLLGYDVLPDLCGI